jgi:hypothetical protein
MKLPQPIRGLKFASSRRRKLPFPAAPGLRIAQVTAGPFFQHSERFFEENWAGLPSFAPAILAGSAPDLLSLAGQFEAGLLDLTSVDVALFALAPCPDPPLTQLSRDILWHTFGLPVFELITEQNGAILASECDAHLGWHLEPGVVLGSRELSRKLGIDVCMNHPPCPCGRPGAYFLDGAACEAPAQPSRLAATA